MDTNRPQLEEVLDLIVEDFARDAPEVPEFEAAFVAVQLNLTVLVQALAMLGVQGKGLTNEELYHMCSKLTETCQWMAAKLLAADTMREIEN